MTSSRDSSSTELIQAIEQLITRNRGNVADDLVVCQRIDTNSQLCYAVYPHASVRSPLAEVLHETLQRPLSREKVEWVITDPEAIQLIIAAHMAKGIDE